MSAPDTPGWAFDTLAVRAGQERSQFNEHNKGQKNKEEKKNKGK